MRTLRRALRLLVYLAGALALATVAAVLVARLVLDLEPGRRWLARMAVERATEALPGSVEIGDVRLRGSSGARLEDVVLLAPDGREAARMRSVTLGLRLPALLRGEVVIDQLQVEGLVIDAAPDAQGDIPLFSALQPGEERDQPGGGGGPPIRVEGYSIDVEQLVWRDRPGAAPRFEARGGTITGSLSMVEEVLLFDATLALALTTPARGEANGEVAGRLAEDRLTFSRFSWVLPGQVQLDATTPERADEPPPREDPADAPVPQGGRPGLLERLHLEVILPRDGLVPYGGPRLASELRISANLRLAERIEFDAVARPRGPGEIHADGWFTTGDDGRFAATTRVEGLDPARLLPGAPRGRLWAGGSLSGRLAFPPEASAQGRLSLRRFTSGGATFGPARGEIRLRGASIEARGLQATLPGARVAGRVRLDPGRLPAGRFDVAVNDLSSLSQAARAVGLRLPEASGTLDLEVESAGTPGTPELRLEARAPGLQVGGLALTRLRVDASRTGDAMAAHVEATSEAGVVGLTLRARRESPRTLVLQQLALRLHESAWIMDRPALVSAAGKRVRIEDLVLHGPGRVEILHLDVPDPRVRFAGEVTANAQIDRLRLDALTPLLPEHSPRGVLDARLTLSGTVAAPQMQAEVAVDDLQVSRSPRLSADVRLVLSEGRSQAEGWLLVAGGALARFDVSAVSPVDPRLTWSEWLARSRVEAQVDLPAVDLDAFSRAGLLPRRMDGSVRGRLEVRGLVRHPDVEGWVELRDMQVVGLVAGELPPTQARLDLAATRTQSTVRAWMQVSGAPPLRGTLQVGAPLLTIAGGDLPADTRLNGSLAMQPGRIEVPALGVMAGNARLEGRLSGTPSRPVIAAEAGARDVLTFGKPVGDLSLRVDTTATRWAGSLRVDPENGGSLAVDLAGPPRGARGQWIATIAADRARLDFLQLAPRVRLIEQAFLDGRLELREDDSGPVVDGALQLRASRLAVAEIGTGNRLQLSLVGAGRELRLEDLSVRTGRGGLEAGGRLAWKKDGWDAEASLDFENFPVPTPLKPMGTVTTKLTARATEQDRVVAGDVRLSPGEVRLEDVSPGRELHPVVLPEDYRIHGRDRPPREEPWFWQRWLAERVAEVRLRVPRGFWIRGSGANLDLTADTTARWDGRRLTATGTTEVVRGQLAVLQRRFEVSRLLLSFVGRPGFDPDLQGELVLDERDVTIEVEVGGRLLAPEVNLTSDPPMPAGEIALMLASGPGGISVGSGLAGTALSGALNFLAGQVGTALSEYLPLDVLAFELGPGGEARQIEAGAYLTPRLFVSFVRNMLAEEGENTNEVQAEYQLRRSLSLRSYFGDRQAGGVDLLFQRRFHSPAQREALRRREEERKEPPERAPPPPAD